MSSQLIFPESVALALRPTPLQRLRYAPKNSPDVRLWCKRDDLTGSVLTGNKVRKLEYILADALEQGADTLVTCGGLQSNHCRAAALVAAQYGLACRLILRDDDNDMTHSDGNLLLSQLAGAQIQIYPASVYRQQLANLFAEVRREVQAQGGRPYLIPTGASNGVGLWGYVAAARELAQDFAEHRIENPLVICAAGSGGTLAGLAAGLQYYAPEAEVLGVAVCDTAAYFQRRVREDVDEAIRRFAANALSCPPTLRVVDDYIGPGYAKGYPEIFALIRELAASDGLVLDPVYTAKAFYGMLCELAQKRVKQRDIVFIHTGGVFGLFPYKNHL